MITVLGLFRFLFAFFKGIANDNIFCQRHYRYVEAACFFAREQIPIVDFHMMFLPRSQGIKPLKEARLKR